MIAGVSREFRGSMIIGAAFVLLYAVAGICWLLAHATLWVIGE